MSYGLRAGMAFCFAGENAIFMDVPQDRFFGTSRRTSKALRQLVAGEPIDDAMILHLEPLIRLGVISHNAASTSPLAPTEYPSRLQDLGPTSSTGPGIIVTIAAALRQSVAELRLRCAGFPRLAKRFSHAKAAVAGIRDLTDPNIQTVLSAHQRAAGLVSSRQHCLARSFTLGFDLLRANMRCELILGVRTGPFAAHAWLVHGATILNDAAENVRLYTPILVL